MKAVILCGGKGGRMAVPNMSLPSKPLVEIGGRAMLHRIMDYYYNQGINDFVLALGHRAGEIMSASGYNPDWNVKFVYTGSPDNVGTGGRLKKLYNEGYIDETFVLGYCDVLTDVRVKSLINLHKISKSLLTLVATNPIVQFGCIDLEPDELGASVVNFSEKPKIHDIWANEGVYIVEPEFVEGISNLEAVSFESSVIPLAASLGKVYAFMHDGVWLPVNSYSDLLYVNQLWDTGYLNWLQEPVAV